MKGTTILATLLLLPLASHADGFGYTFVEGGVVNTEIDVGPADIDGDGLGINGSFGLNDSLHVIAGYTDVDYDFGIDGSVTNVGLGFNTSLSADLDFVADVSYVDAEIATGFGSADETGYGLGAGVRGRATDRVELEARLGYVDLDDSDTAVQVGGRYYLSDSFALGAGLTDNDAGLTWTLGLRAEFGGR